MRNEARVAAAVVVEIDTMRPECASMAMGAADSAITPRSTSEYAPASPVA
jgi:hypothetical protein